MKKILLLFMAVLTLGVTARASDGDEFTVDNLKYKVLSEVNSEVAIMGPRTSFKESNLTIPSSVIRDYSGHQFSYSVVEIGFSAFEECTSLTSVTIPNSVTEIGEYAFKKCTSLTSVTIPNSVTKIALAAFEQCTSLTSVIIPNSVTEISVSAFSGCTSLTSVTIPKSVTEILHPFTSCDKLEEILVEDGNPYYASVDGVLYQIKSKYSSYYEEKTLIQCPGAKESVNIPDWVNRIGECAFEGCRSLTSVTIPNSVTEISSNAFWSCSNLTSVKIPGSVTKIRNYAFSHCEKLEEILVEDGNPNYVSVDGVLYEKNNGSDEKLTLIQCPNAKETVNISNRAISIDSDAFYECRNLTSIVIPNSVVEIGNSAFQNCSNLTSIVIPGSVKSIYNDAFSNCSKIKKIYVLNTTPPATASYTFNKVPTTAVVYIPKGSYKAYYFAENWEKFTDFIEMGALDIKLNKSSISMKATERATLTATVSKDNDVNIESETWATSNPEVATVSDGVVTAVAEGSTTITYTVVDNYGCPHTEYCTVTVSGSAGVEGVEVDGSNSPAEYYNLGGLRVNGDVLTPGLYIKRQGGKATKVLVK